MGEILFFSGDKMCIVWKNYPSLLLLYEFTNTSTYIFANIQTYHLYICHISKPNLQFLAVFEMWKLCIFWVYDFQSSSLKAAAADNEQKTCPGICHV